MENRFIKKNESITRELKFYAYFRKLILTKITQEQNVKTRKASGKLFILTIKDPRASITEKTKGLIAINKQFFCSPK